MNRPYIICHMTTSIDGRVTGEFLDRPECEAATEIYYDINRTLVSNGFICGRVTMESSFTGGFYPDLSKYEPKEKTDFIPKNLSGFYAVAFDTNGKLGWKSACIIDEDPGYGGAQIVEVLSENVDGRYLAYLEELNVPYIFAGKDKIDITLALTKLKELLGVERLLLEGGSIINGAFLQVGAVDELSLVMAPIIAAKEDKPLFTESIPAYFELTKTEVKQGVVILNYKKSKK